MGKAQGKKVAATALRLRRSRRSRSSARSSHQRGHVRPRAEPQSREKTWLISVLMNKRSERFSAERETIYCKGWYRLPRTDRGNTAPPRLREPGRNAGGLIEELRGGLPLPRSVSTVPRFSAPIYVFDDEGDKRTSLGPSGRKNWLGWTLRYPTRLELAGLHQNDQARP